MLNYERDGKANKFELMVLNWWQLGLIIVLIPAVGFLVYHFIVFIASVFIVQSKRRMESEMNHFQQLGELAGRGDPGSFYKQLMKWYDHFRSLQTVSGPGLARYIALSGDRELAEGYDRLKEVLYGKQKGGEWSGERFYTALKRYRKMTISEVALKSTRKLADNNPS